MKRIHIFFNLFFLFSTILSAQTDETIFNRYTVNEGISQSSISCLLQDSEGYIWFGTQNGLNRFNGYSFERYCPDPEDTTSISHGWIYSITEDAEGNIWVGSRGGLNKFDKKKATFEHIPAKQGKNSLFSNLVYGVAYHDGFIYVNTPPVLNVVNVKTKQIIQYKNNIYLEKRAGSFEKGFPIFVDRQKNVWIATPKGLSKFISAAKKFNNYYHYADDNSSIPDDYINAIYQDKQGEIWIGTSNGLCRYDPSTDTFIRIENKFKNNSIQTILQDNNGNFWLGTYGGGLNFVIFDTKKTRILDTKNYSNDLNDEKTIINDVVSCLYQDHSHIIWIGTFLGMNALDMKPKKFLLYKKTESEHSINLLDNFIASVYKDKNEILWIGNWGKGLNLLNTKTGHVKQYAPNLPGKQKIVNGYVHVIFKDPDDNMWIATRNGIQVLNLKDSSFVDLNDYFKIEGLPEFRNTRIRKLFRDSRDNIWVGSNSGLYKISRENREVYPYLNNSNPYSISDNLIYDILETKAGKFWIGTVNGLNFYDPSTESFTRYFNDPHNLKSLSSSMIINLLMDHDENLWIGTNCGLNLLKKGSSSFIHFSRKDGLPDDYIYNMIEDSSNKIWFSTNGGIGVIDTKTKRISSFKHESGLQGLEFGGGAYFKSEAGEFFFGGTNGLNSFYPNIMPTNNFIPPVVITSFEKSNDKGKEKKIVKSGDVVELSYSDYEIVIEFAALDYTNTKANQYAYKMEGLSSDWISTDNRNFVTFSKLPPDKYTFSVRGSNNDNKWNTTGASITIIIHPPFWRTWWFYSLCIIIIAGTIVFLFKLRERALLNEKNLLEAKVKERTEEVVYQHEQIEKQKDELIKKNIKITDSIDYAKQIQDAFLPSVDQIKQIFPESFILFMPKDIVSGDFYWLHTKTGKVLFAVADCTGHGVPGAFMSLISINLLNEIMERKVTTVPSEILETLRSQLTTSFKQKKGEERRQNGLDVALCSFDPSTYELSYAGAKNSLYLFRNNTFTEIKADKHTVGMFQEQANNKFTNHTLKIEKGDVIYLFTDGFADQKGGPLNKKYYYLPFQQLCIRIQDMSMEEQKQELEKVITDWKGNIEQIDDILIMGIRF
jgi:ligand-binding sensor domain-containing protein/serine phosphatase RsbU (regulator of sigma subunit)